MSKLILSKSPIFVLFTVFHLTSGCASKNICEEERTEKEAIPLRCQEEAETEEETGTTEAETDGPIKGELDCPDVAIPYYKCTLDCHQQVRPDGEYGCDPELDKESDKAQAYQDCLKACDIKGE